MDIKLIIMDVDGTLTNSKKVVTKKTKDALMDAQRKGIRLVLASGRPTSGLLDLAKELEMEKYNGYLVSYNGSCAIECKTNTIIFNQAMSVEECKAVLEHVKSFDIIPMIDKGEYMYVNNVYNNIITLNNKPFNVVEYESRGGNFLLCEKEDLSAFVDFEINKILTAATPEYLQANYEKIAEPFKDTLHCVFTSPFFFEFTAKGIDKAKALDTIFKPQGVLPEHMIAFGDGQNDISMLQYAKYGVAMENANQEVKDHCCFVTKSNDEDGIAFALEKYI